MSSKPVRLINLQVYLLKGENTDAIVNRSSEYYLEYECGCENHLAKLKPCDSPFEYAIPEAMRQKTLRAFFWSVIEEYMLFELRSATRLVYADNLTIVSIGKHT
ncbi:hypothetical protein [Phormidesmis priestleyi]